MRVEQVYRGRTVKIVTLGDIPPAPGDLEQEKKLVDTALEAAGETRSSIFGYGVEWFSATNQANVTIHID